MTRILITGADSFIGKNFIAFSKFRNVKVVSLLGLAPENIDYNDIDVVIHLAAIVHGDDKIPESEYFRINRDLTKSVAISAKKAHVKHFIFFSTIKVYGRFLAGSTPWNEHSPCYPEDAYGRSKYEAETELRNLASPEFFVSIIRTPLVYGPGVKANLLKLIRLIEKFPILPFGSLNNTRHYTYVENLIGYVDRIIETGASGIFLAMDGTPLSTSELVRILSECLDRKVYLFRLYPMIIRILQAWGPKLFERLYGSFYLDNTRTRKVLNYDPPYSPDEGFKRTVSFYLGTQK